MSINVYEYEERISYDSDKPSVYLGYYISTSSDSAGVTNWNDPSDRTEWSEQIAKLFSFEDWRLPGCALLWMAGDNDGDRDWGYELLTIIAKDNGVEDIDPEGTLYDQIQAAYTGGAELEIE